MSITVKLITKKLGFFSSVQPMMCSRSHVILVYRRFLTNQTLSSHLEKLPETRCLTNTYHNTVKAEDIIPISKSRCICFGLIDKVSTADCSRQIPEKVALYPHDCMSELSSGNDSELEHLFRLRARILPVTSDDIILRENYLSFNTNKEEDQCSRLKCSSSGQNQIKSRNQNIGRPTDEQLITVRESLAKTLPLLFVQTLDYRYYHPNVVLINNIRGSESKGLVSYVGQVAILRALGHMKFAYVKFEILKITSHPEDSTVRVRWRVRGIKGYIAVWNVVRHWKWRAHDQLKDQELWLDGFSTYFIGPDGLIQKHVVDKMMPDDDRVIEKTKDTASPLAAKLTTLCVGLTLSAKNSILPSIRIEPGESQNL